jgi:transposase
MNTHTKNTTNTPEATNSKPLCKLGLDVHAAFVMAVCQIEGSNPQPAQRFTSARLLAWVEGLLQKGYAVYSCYEAGPTGYWLHRRLLGLGVTNYVVCPTRLDSRGKGVNTDATDALELLVRLDRFVAGNRKAFSVVRVPSPEQEQKRIVSRQREQLQRKRLSFAAQGRMLLLNQGIHQGNGWWQPARWDKFKDQWPVWLVECLEKFRRTIEFLQGQIKELSAAVEAGAPACLPRGMGALTHQVLQNEIKDWKLFNNRRQIGSYSGLTGGVSASGQQHADLSITKAGNRRLSCCLVECAWRMLIRQPNYWLVKKWRAVLLNPKAHVRRRKQLIVAFARQLLIDIWKWKTGRATPESLGWVMTQPEA